MRRQCDAAALILWTATALMLGAGQRISAFTRLPPIWEMTANGATTARGEAFKHRIYKIQPVVRRPALGERCAAANRPIIFFRL